MRADAFPTVRFLAFAGTGLAVGVALVAWLGERPSEPSPSEPPPSSGMTVRAVEPEVQERDSGQTPAPLPPPPPPPSEPPPIAFQGERVVTPGRVAYLRCDGVPACTRDPTLETAVWAVLATLPRCDDPPPGLGRTDVRLELSPATPTEVHARDVHGAPSLDSHRLLACLAGPLSHVRSASHATRTVVSFRLSLDPRGTSAAGR